jgi:hypothetical protein
MPSRFTDDPEPIDPRVIAERLGDYLHHGAGAEREQLVAFWRQAHPEAASQPASWFHPLVLLSRVRVPVRHVARFPMEQFQPDETWTSDVYTVAVRRYVNDPVFRSSGGIVQLGIASVDGSARHDWRDFQCIKNQLAGAECEAFELYPAESRLLDPSNYYSLFCFPALKRIKVGIELRRVLDAEDALSPQRAFSEE